MLCETETKRTKDHMNAINTVFSPVRPNGNGSSALPCGRRAPDFALKSTPDQTVRLSEFRGRPVVLAFYPADWSPVCGDQMGLYNELRCEFEELGAAVLGISVDGPWSHAAFSRDRKLHFPLLADFEPKGEVARLYGVYRSGEGVSERALFVIDANQSIGVMFHRSASIPAQRGFWLRWKN